MRKPGCKSSRGSQLISLVFNSIEEILFQVSSLKARNKPGFLFRAGINPGFPLKSRN